MLWRDDIIFEIKWRGRCRDHFEGVCIFMYHDEIPQIVGCSHYGRYQTLILGRKRVTTHQDIFSMHDFHPQAFLML